MIKLKSGYFVQSSWEWSGLWNSPSNKSSLARLARGTLSQLKSSKHLLSGFLLLLLFRKWLKLIPLLQASFSMAAEVKVC